MRLNFGRREDPRTVALLRVGIGICLLGDLASLLPHTAYLYGDLGLAPAELSCGLPLRQLSLLCVFPGEGPALAILSVGAAAALRTRSTMFFAAGGCGPPGASTTVTRRTRHTDRSPRGRAG